MSTAFSDNLETAAALRALAGHFEKFRDGGVIGAGEIGDVITLLNRAADELDLLDNLGARS